jgi:hypothetical protein
MRLAEGEASPASSAFCCAVLRLLHSKGTPAVPLQVRMVRAVGPSAVMPTAPVLAQLPPVSTQEASQLMVGLADRVLVVAL